MVPCLRTSSSQHLVRRDAPGSQSYGRGEKKVGRGDGPGRLRKCGREGEELFGLGGMALRPAMLRGIASQHADRMVFRGLTL